MLHIEIAKVISGLGCNFTNGLGKSWEKKPLEWTLYFLE